MAEIQAIVSKLNEAPFRMNLRLLDLDEKSPVELLEVLRVVLSELDPQHDVDPQTEDPEARVARTMTFLRLMKFQLPNNSSEAAEKFRQGLLEGERNTVYNVLYWILERLPQLQKRAYLARYLAPIEVPQDYFQDENFVQYMHINEELKAEFKRVHKAVDQLSNTDARPDELRRDIKQLEEERRLLVERIHGLRRINDEKPGFAEMLEATKAFRLAQEDDHKQIGRREEQRMLLQAADARLQKVRERERELQATAGASSSPERIVEQLEREVRSLVDRVQVELPRMLKVRRSRLKELDHERGKPQRSAQDVTELRHFIDTLESNLGDVRSQLDKTVKDSGDNRTMMYLQHTRGASQKLAERQDTMDTILRQQEELREQIAMKERSMEETMEGGQKFMTQEQKRNLVLKLKEKSTTYKRMKKELSDQDAELVVLHRTEQLLKRQAAKLDIDVSLLEAKQGVSGYRDTKHRLETAAEATAATDKEKARLIEDITQHVTEMQRELNGRKRELQPLMKQLQQERQRCREVGAAYNERKAAFDQVKVGLQLGLSELERSCKELEAECFQEESKYYHTSSMKAIAEAKWARVQQEEKWRHGEGRLMRDFQTYMELYNDKLRSQQDLSRQLRKQQQDIRKNEGPNSQQREMFANMHKLLLAKKQSQQKQLDGDGDYKEDRRDGFNGYGVSALAYGRTVGGGANVMTIEQGA
uniref:IFT81 calponin homology domain-containing protein n=1 Tax=Pinguiococcus pyrenoidosus TaxID=172671 RepID=A0A7R9UGH9_9STRA|mmetsp:Transcript_9313/g.34866  ORF Transcript_9313/g.34866 Transcript_9313/m.34866 type:complete len:704 (+) Transcript_9313:100-2211(+)